jgi:hypothetical protein
MNRRGKGAFKYATGTINSFADHDLNGLAAERCDNDDRMIEDQGLGSVSAARNGNEWVELQEKQASPLRLKTEAQLSNQSSPVFVRTGYGLSSCR